MLLFGLSSPIRASLFFHVLLYSKIILSLSFASAMSTSSPSSTSQKSAALVFLHGLGDTPAGWSSLETVLPDLESCLKDCLFVFPAAPTIPISINGGMKMPGWFDLYDWPIDVGATDDVDGKIRAVQQVQDVIRNIERDYGIARNRIVVGGFSQGGAIALLTAYHESDALPQSVESPLAACVALSAWWTMQQQPNSKVVDGATSTPLFWAHGTYDDKVLFAQQAHGVQALRDGGVKHIVDHQYPMGHMSHPQELKDMAAFLKDILFPADKKSPPDL